jgi:hypothetical protein
MSGSVGVERIFPVNLLALQKSWNQQKVQFVELEFSTSENLLVKKAKIKTKEDSQYSYHKKSPDVSDFFCFFLKPIEYTNKMAFQAHGVIRKIFFCIKPSLFLVWFHYISLNFKQNIHLTSYLIGYDYKKNDTKIKDCLHLNWWGALLATYSFTIVQAFTATAGIEMKLKTFLCCQNFIQFPEF